MRFFNTAGPCRADIHYLVPSQIRLDEFDVRRLIEQQSYFVVHAPRQVGKTTAMMELAKQLTAEGKYTAALVSMEVGAPFPDDVPAAEQAILQSWQQALNWQLPAELRPPTPCLSATTVSEYLNLWAIESPRPIVIFLDEIDALQNDALLSVLRQLRSAYSQRPTHFPQSLALIGLRDVRDYKIASGGRDRLVSPSPFNIAVRSITLRNFNEAEVRGLLGQHTAETGQTFTEEALQYTFDQTQGQPWLVNALAKISTEELVRDLNEAVTAEHVRQAREILIQRRQTHLDQLADKLRHPRVRHVIEPILAGKALGDIARDDIDYVIDLGLVRQQNGSGLLIANPIYREIIPRELSSVPQASLPYITPSWLNGDGTLNPATLLEAFLAFWRQHGQPLLGSAPYHEIAPHLVLMAFLQRVVNGGGWLEREYAIGTRRMDLLLRYGRTSMAMELKIWRDKNPIPDGLTQLDTYLDGLGLETGWLVIFDQRPNLPEISERTTAEPATTPSGKQITLIMA